MNSRARFVRIKQNESDYRRATAERLLDLYNETWNDGEPIDAGTFASRIRLDAITFYSEGAEVFYDDGDLFAGHSILVHLNPEGVIEDAHIGG